MKNSYRINVRFDLNTEVDCIDYLNSLTGSRNAFIVNAVKEKIQRGKSGYDTYLEDIREIVHEELTRVASFSASKETTVPKENNEDDILNSLSAFGL